MKPKPNWNLTLPWTPQREKASGNHFSPRTHATSITSPLCCLYHDLLLISVWQVFKFQPISARVANSFGVHSFASVSRNEMYTCVWMVLIVFSSTFVLFRLLRILRFSRPVLRHRICYVKRVIYADIATDGRSKLRDKIKLLPCVMVILPSRLN